MEFASRQTGFSSLSRIVIVGPIHRKFPGVVVVGVDKIAERCKEATASAETDLERTPKNPRREPSVWVRWAAPQHGIWRG